MESPYLRLYAGTNRRMVMPKNLALTAKPLNGPDVEAPISEQWLP